MSLKFLEWDSSFFKKNIYRLDLLDIEDPIDSIITKEANADLIYIFVHKYNNISNQLCLSLGARLYDKKVTYQKKYNNGILLSKELGNIKSIRKSNKNVINLAIKSGLYSRFRLDPNLSPYFEALYEVWLEKSIEREIADEVCVMLDEHTKKEIGLITVKIDDVFAKIGLLSVDEEARGRGVASSMLLFVDLICMKYSIKSCEVVTQMDNEPACRLYEKAGFSIKSVEYIYHLWKNEYTI